MLPLARPLHVDCTWLFFGFISACLATLTSTSMTTSTSTSTSSLADERKVIVYPTVSTGSDGAFIDCPCVKTPNIALYTSESDMSEEYGSYCTPWSITQPYCKVLDPPGYCSRNWCHVDRSQCDRVSEISQLFKDKHYSYQTCGSIDLFTKKEDIEPADGYYNGLMYNGLGRWQPSNIRQYEKVTARYARDMLDRMGVNPDKVKHRATTDASKKLYSSSFTAMAHDIAVGNIHFGFYCFWQTAERINLGVSPIPFYSDDFFFFTPKVVVKTDGFWSMLASPFRPFSWDLWLLILGTVFFAAINLAFVEYGVIVTCRNPKHILRELYHAFISLLSGAISVPREKPAGRMIALGFSIFIVVIVASFTGSTASFLVGRDILKITSFEDAIRNRESICYHSVIGGALAEVYPVMREIGVPQPWTSESILAQVNNGACKHAIAPNTEIENKISCSFVKTGDPIMHIPVGPLVQRKLGTMFYFQHAKLGEIGVWGDYKNNLFAPHSCPEYHGDKSRKVTKLHAKHMLGICLILAVCSVVALVLHLCYVVEKEVEKEVEETLEGKAVTNGDQPQEKNETEESLHTAVEVSDDVAPIAKEEDEQKLSSLLQNVASKQTAQDLMFQVGGLRETMQHVKASLEEIQAHCQQKQAKLSYGHSILQRVQAIADQN